MGTRMESCVHWWGVRSPCPSSSLLTPVEEAMSHACWCLAQAGTDGLKKAMEVGTIGWDA